MMILPNKKDAIHKVWLYRILTGIYDNAFLASVLYFKGGTAAAMRGLLDRFSVDLDFDFVGKDEQLKQTRTELEKIFSDLGLEIADASKKVPQYFLKYPNTPQERSTLKVDVTTTKILANTYEPVQLAEINRIVYCQSIETMFANKLVATIERFEKGGSIAGRDIYDIHHFFLQGFSYSSPVIVERRGTTVHKFFEVLTTFVDKHITETVINQDINMLLTPDHFQKLRKILKNETMQFLKDEVERTN